MVGISDSRRLKAGDVRRRRLGVSKADPVFSSGGGDFGDLIVRLQNYHNRLAHSSISVHYGEINNNVTFLWGIIIDFSAFSARLILRIKTGAINSGFEDTHEWRRC